MIVTIRVWVLLALATFPLPIFAQEACDIINTLERIQFAQIRLAKTDQPTAAAPDALLLRDHLNRLDILAVQSALTDRTSSSQQTMVLQFLKNALQLDALLRSQANENARIFMRSETFQAAQSSIKSIIPQFNCNDTKALGNDGGSSVSQGQLSALDSRKQFDLPTITFVAVLLFLSILFVVGVGFAANRYMKQKDRRAKRYRTFIQTTLRLEGEDHPVTILDLSCNGAKLQLAGATVITDNTMLHVFLNDHWKNAAVTWHNQHFCGVRFEQHLRVSTILQLQQQRVQTPAPNAKTAPV